MVSPAARVISLDLTGAETAGPSGPVRSALSKEKFPWYDAKTDTVKPVWSSDYDWSWLWNWLPDWKLPGMGGAGEAVGYLFAAIALVVLIVVLVVLWRNYRPSVDERAAALARAGALRIEGLPEGLQPETSDPWAEALRRRERGDYAGAIVCLFAHQLLTLERLKMVRLIPGRTGRQLVRSVADPSYRGPVEPTLRLFETVYYGHRPPTAAAFEAVWTLAEGFERHVAARPVS